MLYNITYFMLYNITWHMLYKMTCTGKNNRFPFLDILGYLKNTHKNPKTSPNQGTWLGIPWLRLVSLFQIWDFCGFSLNTLKYPKMGIGYFFLWWHMLYNKTWHMLYKITCVCYTTCVMLYHVMLCYVITYFTLYNIT